MFPEMISTALHERFLPTPGTMGGISIAVFYTPVDDKGFGFLFFLE